MSIILTTTIVALLITCISYLIYEYYAYRRETVAELSLMTRLIAANSTAALAFENAEDAKEILATVAVEPKVMSAALYDSAGNLFASYQMNGINLPNMIEADGFRFVNETVIAYVPVVHQGNRLGTLYIQQDMKAMYNRFASYLLIGFLVIVAAMFVAYLLSRKFQKTLSGPILDLAGTARAIAEHGDYTVRARKYDNDEIGLLTDAFNRMLIRIEFQNQEIIALNLGLEAKVAERTKELQTAYRELESFSYTVSHDLNAPLRHIDNHLHIFRNRHASDLDESAKRALDNVTRNVGRMRQLIDDLLLFFQLGKRELVKREIAMEELVRNIWDEQRQMEEHRNLELNISVLPHAHGDESSIRQVWVNLISNAIKYTRPKDPAIVKIMYELQEDGIVYCIQDNGVGFDMAHYDKLFDAFERLHSQSEFDGTGVGLAIVERIVIRHGGSVWATAAPGEGATFCFKLPWK